MTNDPQHNTKEEEEEQVQLPEEIEKRLHLDKMEEEEEQTRKRKDVKQNIDTQSCHYPRPPSETETGNSVNESVLTTCEVEGEVAEVYEPDNEVKTDDAQYDIDIEESRTLCEILVDGTNSKEISSSSVRIDSIRIGSRFRKDLGDIALLAENIREIGLLHPIVVNQNHELISGLRRIEAFKLLGRSEIPAHIVNLDDTKSTSKNYSENQTRAKVAKYISLHGKKISHVTLTIAKSMMLLNKNQLLLVKYGRI